MKNNVQVNCVVPVADSRMTETVLSADVRELLSPLHIAPLVLYLAHENSTSSGDTYEVGGGFFSKTRVQRSKGVLLGSKTSPAQVEDIASAMTQLSDFTTDPYAPTSLSDSLQKVLSSLAKKTNGGGGHEKPHENHIPEKKADLKHDEAHIGQTSLFSSNCMKSYADKLNADRPMYVWSPLFICYNLFYFNSLGCRRWWNELERDFCFGSIPPLPLCRGILSPGI